MRSHTPQFLPTSFALVVATIVLVAGVFLDIDLLPGIGVIGIEPSEAGEVMAAFFLVVAAFLVDHIVSRERGHAEVLQAERLRVVHVTMRTVQDIVNNALNQLQFVRLEAEEAHVSQDVLALFDETIQDTVAKLRELGDLETYVETQMGIGTGLASGAHSS
ncbi:MAG: hypothetical protein JWN70_6332 [Planctomycetaceae bacterium]|nr:hypothetical protein [Planctomycetaceae bacterium]